MSKKIKELTKVDVAVRPEQDVAVVTIEWREMHSVPLHGDAPKDEADVKHFLQTVVGEALA